MLSKALALAEEYGMLPVGSMILCAVSGGADSMCLLHFFYTLGKSRGFSVCAAHYHHGLRGAEADRDEAFVKDWCGHLHIPVLAERGDVPAEAARSGLGLEETGRLLRYDFLERAARALDAACIATAHNADDNVETLLLHLVRGAGLRGLSGIPPRRGNLIRPLLTTTRTEIEAYLSENAVPFVRDTSNADPVFSRNRLRAGVMPVLKEMNPHFVENTAGTMAVLRGANDYLNARAAEAAASAHFSDGVLSVDRRSVADQPAALAPLVARRLLTRAGAQEALYAAHLNAVVALARSPSPSGRVALPGGMEVRRVYESLTVAAPFAGAGFAPVLAVPGGVTAVPETGWFLSCRPAKAPKEPPCATRFFLRGELVSAPLTLRPRRTGDEITLPRRARKSLKKLFIEARVPRWERENVPVLATGGTVLAVGGFGPDARFLAAPGEAALEIILEERQPEGEM